MPLANDSANDSAILGGKLLSSPPAPITRGSPMDWGRTAPSLAVDYVWIDSLCIVQDDRDEWAGEVVRMCNIYENPVFTLAATKAARAMRAVSPCLLRSTKTTTSISH
jgi:hypothetical protein